MIPHQEQCSKTQKFMSKNPKDTTVIAADNSFQKRISMSFKENTSYS